MGIIAAALLTYASVGQPVDLLKNGAFSTGSSSWSSASEIKHSNGGPGGRKFITINVAGAAPATPWVPSLVQELDASVAAGEAVSLSFWAKSTTSQPVIAMVEEPNSPYEKIWQKEFVLSPEWKEYQASLPLSKKLDGGYHRFLFHLGTKAGDVSFTGLKLMAKAMPAPPRASVTKPISLVENGNFEKPLEGTWTGGDRTGATASVKTSPTTGKYVSLQFVSGPEVKNPWDIQFAQAVKPAVYNRDLLDLRLKLRSPTKTSIWVVYELAVAPNTKAVYRKLDLTPQWKEYRLKVPVSRNFPVNGSSFKLFMGTQTGTVDVDDISLVNYGPDAPSHLFATNVLDYDANKDTAWRKAANERIEKLRKGTVRVRFVDAQGKAITGATVQVKQTSHHFKFGTAVTAQLLNNNGPDGVRYKKALQAGFNTAVFENDMKWPGMAYQPWDQTLKAAQWLRDRKFEIRGHNLVWGSFGNLPTELRAMSVEETKAAIRARVKDAAAKTKDWVYVWDAVNEAVTETELWDKIGWDEFANVFKLAKAEMPHVKLAYNDYNITNDGGGTRHREAAVARVKQLQKAGAPVDIFGDQAHMSAPGPGMTKTLKIWDDIHAELKIPLEVTEFDFPSWEDKGHADFTEDYVTAAFSHPAMEAVVFWGFWEGAHWLGGQGGALISRDWKPRPSWERYLKLVNQTWRTKAKVKATPQGASVRGFYGGYKATATLRGRAVTGEFLIQPENSKVITVKLTPANK